jgi:3-methyladenine DNA glycosylase/8-oxoguanine DNA glycosylase
MKEYAASYFGEYGGIAQQYLFYFMRNMSKNADREEPPESYELPAGK